jgi:hypothetical protein
MDEDTIDTRVGMAAISVLYNITEEYIKAHTVDGEFKGELQYIDKLKMCAGILEGKYMETSRDDN